MNHTIKEIIKKLLYLAPVAGVIAARGAMAVAVSIPSNQITGITSFFGILCTMTNYFFTLIMIIAILIFLYAAFVFLTAGDSAEGQKRAKNLLIYGIVGVIVAVLPKAILIITASFFTGDPTGASVNPCP